MNDGGGAFKWLSSTKIEPLTREFDLRQHQKPQATYLLPIGPLIIDIAKPGAYVLAFCGSLVA
jgi:hypothetical protein